MLGDSIVANMGSGEQIKLSPSVYSRTANRGVSGHTVAQFLSDWQDGASSFRGDSRLKWVMVMGWVNDILQGRSSAQILADYSTLITDIQTNNASATIMLAKATPMKTYLNNQNGGYYAIYQAVDSGLASTYPTLYDTTIHDALADGNDDLQSTYGGAGTLHPNATGQVKQVDTLVTWLNALSGGWT